MTANTVEPIHAADQAALEKRLDEETEKRDALQNKLKTFQTEFESLLTKAPKRHRETVAECDKEMNDLERQRTINSIPLSEEREILKQISRVQKKKREVEEFNVYDKQIKEKKAEVYDLRETLKKMRSEIVEIRSELSLVRMANQIGCSKDELVCMKVECPQDKLGTIIGKKGSTVKQLSQKSNVNLNVNRKEGDIHITGALDNLQAAASDIDKVISTRQEDFEAPNILVDYMTSKHVTKLEEIRTNYPDLYVQMKRKETTVVARGIPEDLENFKFELLNLEIKMKTVDLPSAVASYLVGKKGATIDGLVLLHQVAIQVERKEEGSKVTLIGPQDNVVAAAAAIQEIAEKMREESVTIPIESLAKEALLMNGGAGIQAINKIANAEKDPETTGYVSVNFEDNSVIVKGRHMLLGNAVDVVKREIHEVEKKIITIEVDTYVIPKLIGKGGENIKKITEGKHVGINFDRVTGKVMICGLKDEEVKEVEQRVRDILAENTVARISLDAAIYKIQIRDFLRKAKEISAICHFHCDDENCQVILRGTEEQLKEASDMVRDYLQKNYVEELSVSNDELRTLLTGGKESKIAALQNEQEVTINSDRDRNVVVVRGTSEKVKKALDTINQYLFGGAGYAVEQLELDKEQVGLVIGKEGKNKAELQKKYEKVTIAVNGVENKITLRGPESDTEACRVAIIKLVSTMQITRSLEVDDKNLEFFKTNKSILRGVPVALTIEEAKKEIKVRGYSDDVRHALSILQEKISGQYESRLKVATPQFRKIKDSCRDSNLLDRIRKMTGASIVIDSSDECVVFKGKKKHVKSCKMEFMKLLDFVLGSSFARIELSDAVISTVGKIPVLAEIAAVTGASVNMERDINTVLISGKAEKVEIAAKVIRAKVEEAEKLSFVIQLEPSEDWLVSAIIGKKGASIKNLRKETNCAIEVDSTERRVTVTSESAELVASARETFDAFIKKNRSEHVVVLMPENDMPAFVGRGGGNVTKFQKEHGVDVQILKGASSAVVLRGNADAVLTAKNELLEWLQGRDTARNDAEAAEKMQLRRYQVPAVIGPKGATVIKLQQDSGCKIDINKDKAIVNITGGNAEKRADVVKKIQEILDGEGTGDANGTGTEAPKSPGRAKRSEKSQPKSPGRKAPQAAPTYTATGTDFPALPTDENKSGDESDAGRQQVGGGSAWSSVVKSPTPKVDVPPELNHFSSSSETKSNGERASAVAIVN